MQMPSLDELIQTEWSSEFEWLMRARLIMGPFRGYGRFGSNTKSQYDRVGRMTAELETYQRTHNLECLVEIATHAMLEYVETDHPDTHYAPSDSQGETERRYRRARRGD
jgi:hypothetical protein